MFDIGGPEVLVILFIFLLLFGADKMPGMAKGLGKSIREFKKAASSVEDEIRRAMDEEPARPAPKPAGTIDQQAGAAQPPPPSPPPPHAD